MNHVREFLHKLFLRTVLEVATLDDMPGSVEALVRPNIYRNVQKRMGLLTVSSLVPCYKTLP